MSIVAINAISSCVFSVCMVVLLPPDLELGENCRREREIFSAFHNNLILLNQNILERMKDVAGEGDLQE